MVLSLLMKGLGVRSMVLNTGRPASRRPQALELARRMRVNSEMSPQDRADRDGTSKWRSRLKLKRPN